MIMKKVWKWIIGIVIGLIVVGALIGMVCLAKSHWSARTEVMGAAQPGYFWHHPGFIPNDAGRCDMYSLPQRGFGMRGPGMMGYGRMPFGGLMWVLPLGFFVLVILGIVWLIKALRKPKATPILVHACKYCGKHVQDDWKNCPHCGKKQ
jgi:hypothetical protein